MKHIFLHGLDSSSKGTKGRFFRQAFPEMIIPDFDGSLDQRMAQLESICGEESLGEKTFSLIGSSFGGLMAACFGIAHPDRTAQLFLLAPALNFPGFRVPEKKVTAPTYLLIGKHDLVTPPSQVLPLAEKTFANLEVELVDEDHLLHTRFFELDWPKLLGD